MVAKGGERRDRWVVLLSGGAGDREHRQADKIPFPQRPFHLCFMGKLCTDNN